MNRIVLTGGPGAGKTTVLAELSRIGFEVRDDAARSIIRQRKLAGMLPRPEPVRFAEMILERELVAYGSPAASPVFFERGVVDAVGALASVGGIDTKRANQLIRTYPYDRIFMFPPWKEIYRTDDERDHTFSHAVEVYESTFGLYRRYGYEPIEMPLDTVAYRVRFVLDAIVET